MYIFVGEIENQGLAAVANAEVTAHELGHQFELTNVDANHQDVWCHLGQGTDRCIMDTTALHPTDPENGITELCHDGDDHLVDVRDFQDNL